MSNKCCYCSKEFSNKANLKYHVKNAKYCLTKRNDATLSSNIIDIELLKTEYDCKVVGLKDENDELMSCIRSLNQKLDMKDELINGYQIQIDKLQDKLENLARCAIEKPTSTTNINARYVNMPSITHLTPEYIEKQITEGFDRSVLYECSHLFTCSYK